MTIYKDGLVVIPAMLTTLFQDVIPAMLTTVEKQVKRHSDDRDHSGVSFK